MDRRKPRPPYFIVRLMWVRFLAMLLLPILGYRLFTVGVLEHKIYSDQAKNQYAKAEEVPSKRGEIYIQNKGGYFPVAANSKKFQIWAVPKNIANKKEASQKLAPFLDLPEEDIFNAINNDKLYIPPLKKRLDEIKGEEIKKLKITGILVVPENVRFYPEGQFASHALGFVNFDNQGAYGVEGYYNNQLTGYAGSVVAEKDNKGRFITIESETAARDGDSLVLTIDQNIQFYAEKLIVEAVDKYDAVSGQMIVLDPKTGGILAMAGTPAFDPNNFNQEAEKDKQEGKDRFTNPLISYVWEPGSIIKPIIVAAGLEDKKFEPDTEAGPFGNAVVVQGYEINTALDRGYGKETITKILENSDNVAMVWVAEQIGNQRMHENFEKFGLGKVLGIDMSGETTGYLLGLKKWRDIHRATMAFGQGISATPLQIAAAYNSLANGGELLLPHIVEKIIKPDGTEIKVEKKVLGQTISQETSQKIAKMLQSVVDQGYDKKAKIEGYHLAGKTGTAQIPKSGGGYEENAYNHSFAGFGPIEAPRFTILIKLDNPTAVKFASSSTAPVFREMAQFLLQYFEIPPGE